MLHSLQVALMLVFPILVTVAALRDLTSFTIPNWISLALIAGFAPAALAAGVTPAGFGLHLAVGAAALVLGMVMFAFGWIGGGDAKLFAAAGLWLGWPACLAYAAFTALAGGGLALVLLGLRSDWVRPFVPNGPAWFGRLAAQGENVPYGVAIAAGALAAFPAGDLLRATSTGF
jgi:prepilin peptidase CpaA